MHRSMHCNLFLTITSLVVLASYIVVEASAVVNLSFPAIIFFGDSIVDAGNNNELLTNARADFLPYGQDFKGGEATGRFSNGLVPSDILVEELGIKPLLPAYLGPSLEPEDLLTGVNFASGGAGYDPLTSSISQCYSLSDQLDLFGEYTTKLKQIAGEERTSEIIRESLFIVVAGSNDITNTYFFTPFRQLQYDVGAYTDLLLTHASTFVEDLYELGARKIGVFSLPPCGCLPLQRTLKGGLERQCVEEYDEAVKMFNAKLEYKLSCLNAERPDSIMAYLNIYDPTMDIIRSPQSYGFKISDRGCCGTGMIEVTTTCRIACEDVLDYVFWDSFHPTEKAYRILVTEILQEYAKKYS